MDRLFAPDSGTELLHNVADWVLNPDVQVSRTTAATHMKVLREVGARPAEIERGFMLDSMRGC